MGMGMQARIVAQGSGKLGWVIAVAMTVVALGQCASDETKTTSEAIGALMFVQAHSLNCRAGASQTEAVVRSLNRNDTVRILETAADWVRVDGYPNCWVSSQFLSATPTVIEDTPAPRQVSSFLSNPKPASYEDNVPPSRANSNRSSFSGRSTYYANCSAARAAGAAPVYAGDPGYSRKLDRDGDGIGCE